MQTRTQVGIVGAGPSGLLLSRLLRRAGIDTVALEHRAREHVEGRIRAGVLEPGTVETLREVGAAQRMDTLGLSHDGFSVAFDDAQVHIDLRGLAGSSVMVWGQTEVTKDLARLHLADGGTIVYEAAVRAIEGLGSKQPTIEFEHQGVRKELQCDFVIGCDGYHGVARPSLGKSLTTFEKTYPFGWLGIIADVPPVDDELIYASHERGFALCSMRSSQRSRYYIQCGLDERVSDWSDAAFWDELRRRLPASVADRLQTGPSLEMSIAPLRSFVVEPMQRGRLFLAGDAAHIVPPTGAKGLNLAVSDVRYLSRALIAHYETGEDHALEQYSEVALRRVWSAIRFSWWFTTLLHRFPDPLQRRLQLAELRLLQRSEASRRVVAGEYLGSGHP